MKRFVLASLFALPAFAASAEPLAIDPAAAIAPAGQVGTGVCARARHTSAYLGSVTNAATLLDGPMENSTGEARFILDVPDLTNGPSRPWVISRRTCPCRSVSTARPPATARSWPSGHADSSGSMRREP